jgi:hypothetical protein
MAKNNSTLVARFVAEVFQPQEVRRQCSSENLVFFCKRVKIGGLFQAVRCSCSQPLVPRVFIL